MSTTKSNNFLLGHVGMPLPHLAQKDIEKLLDSEHCSLKSSYINNSSLFTTGGSIANSDNKIHSCIVGRPQWKSNKLTQIAREYSHADALLVAYREHGTNLFKYLGGKFLLALYNSETDEHIIAIDKIGQQHLFYSLTGNGLIFASSADAIKAISNAVFEIDPQSIFDYFYFHSVPSPQSIYKNINKLIGGHFLHFQNGNMSIIRYWQPIFSETSPSSLARLEEEMLEIISDSVAQHAHHDGIGRVG